MLSIDNNGVPLHVHPYSTYVPTALHYDAYKISTLAALGWINSINEFYKLCENQYIAINTYLLSTEQEYIYEETLK